MDSNPLNRSAYHPEVLRKLVPIALTPARYSTGHHAASETGRVSAPPNPLKTGQWEAICADVQRAWRCLPAEYRQAVVYRIVQDHTDVTLSKATGLSRRKVRDRWPIARADHALALMSRFLLGDNAYLRDVSDRLPEP